MQKANAICYSGFRNGQHPGGAHPSYEQIKEDLLILQHNWRYLRVYDCDLHTQRVLEVIKAEKLDFKVLLGAYITAEMNNQGCPWGGQHSPEQLELNKRHNNARIHTLVKWANQYPDIVCSLSVGNEACVDWTDHYVPVERVMEFTQYVQAHASQPVTFCENYVPWLGKLKPLGEILDFISIHTYPVWEYKHIQESLEYTKDNYRMIAEAYPNKPVVITEAGWCTNANGRGIDPVNVSQENQKIYYDALMDWVLEENILTFVFEAFDESWKGSPDPMEPEKHWGLFNEDRTPKLVVSSLYSNLI
ncbi:MAG: glycosyl hydrolase [Saprospiraceae bacterium]|nr:glycosyl hydrolase [Saprospiraceae bacterium]